MAASSSAETQQPLYVLSDRMGPLEQADIDIAIEQTKANQVDFENGIVFGPFVATAWPRHVWMEAIRNAKKVDAKGDWNAATAYDPAFEKSLTKALGKIGYRVPRDIAIYARLLDPNFHAFHSRTVSTYTDFGMVAVDAELVNGLEPDKRIPLTDVYVFAILMELCDRRVLEVLVRLIKRHGELMHPAFKSVIQREKHRRDQPLERARFAESGIAARLEEKVGDDMNNLVGQFVSSHITPQYSVGPTYSAAQIKKAIKEMEQQNIPEAVRTLKRLAKDLEEHQAKKSRRNPPEEEDD